MSAFWWYLAGVATLPVLAFLWACIPASVDASKSAVVVTVTSPRPRKNAELTPSACRWWRLEVKRAKP